MICPLRKWHLPQFSFFHNDLSFYQSWSPLLAIPFPFRSVLFLFAFFDCFGIKQPPIAKVTVGGIFMDHICSINWNLSLHLLFYLIYTCTFLSVPDIHYEKKANTRHHNNNATYQILIHNNNITK